MDINISSRFIIYMNENRDTSYQYAKFDKHYGIEFKINNKEKNLCSFVTLFDSFDITDRNELRKIITSGISLNNLDILKKI